MDTTELDIDQKDLQGGSKPVLTHDIEDQEESEMNEESVKVNIEESVKVNIEESVEVNSAKEYEDEEQAELTEKHRCINDIKELKRRISEIDFQIQEQQHMRDDFICDNFEITPEMKARHQSKIQQLKKEKSSITLRIFASRSYLNQLMKYDSSEDEDDSSDDENDGDEM
ncbi:MAG: hypothetical protein AAFO15_00505 [Pseudomonadota bacterium]